MPSGGWKIVYHQGTIFFAELRKPGNIGQNPPKSQEGHVFRRLLRPTEMHCRKPASRVTISESRESDARSVRGAGGRLIDKFGVKWKQLATGCRHLCGEGSARNLG